ncbi:hypothetical protein ACHAWF_018611 [Thalassiosira exigua]
MSRQATAIANANGNGNLTAAHGAASRGHHWHGGDRPTDNCGAGSAQPASFPTHVPTSRLSRSNLQQDEPPLAPIRPPIFLRTRRHRRGLRQATV